MTAPTRRRRVLIAAAALAAAGGGAAVLAASVRPGPSPVVAVQGFPRFLAQAAPASWPALGLPGRSAVLYYPPALHPVPGDADAVSVASRGPAGTYLLYLNATPRQGAESLRRWAAFRPQLLREDDASSVHLDAAAAGLAFRGGTGSCVIDDYVSRIGAHHYREIACLVQGQTAASVVVGAAPASRWAQARPVLERAVAAYRVR
jgi:hypothetical protein